VLRFIGSFQGWHGTKNIIEASAKAIREDKDLKLLMIGDGKQFEASKATIKEKNLDKNIFILKKVPHDTILNYINAADVCFAFYDRTFPPFGHFSFYFSPIKLQEYKACGKAIIGSDYPIMHELIKEGKQGLLVNERDATAIYKAIKKLAGNIPLQKMMGKNNVTSIKNKFNWDYFNVKILDKFKKITS